MNYMENRSCLSRKGAALHKSLDSHKHFHSLGYLQQAQES